MTRALVTGAGGFIGHHLVARLKRAGCWVRGADRKLPAFVSSPADEFVVADLRDEAAARRVCTGVDQVYQLAANMGGMGFISKNHADILRDNALINLHMIEAAVRAGAGRYFFASSACIYPEYLQGDTRSRALREEDAYPAAPQDAYGWEKLVAEHLCQHYAEEGRIVTRIGRFHNIYGPLGTWRGGREKAPAAACRKVAEAKRDGHHEIEVWGDGGAMRSYCWIDDCAEGIVRLMASDYVLPLNIGSEESVSVDALHLLAARYAGVEVALRHVPGPQGVRGRNSDNARCREVLGWEPRTPLAYGIDITYRWVESQVLGTVLALET